MISIGKPSVSLEHIRDKVSDFDLAHHYFGVTEIPCMIKSPFRIDNNPSLGFYSKDGNEILWTDFSTKEGGNLIQLLAKYWGESYIDAINHLWEDLSNISNTKSIYKETHNNIPKVKISGSTKIECKVREWRDYDIKFWKSFGISLEWLQYADIYPVSHKIVTKNGIRYVFASDQYAYAYVEFKEGKTTIKIYQPFNTKGFKWSNNHDRSVISLWTKVPKYGENICICASMKDALCLWANTGIPSIAVQGEGYSISETAVNELKRRFKNIYILFDNDDAGLADGVKLAEQTGFTNIVLPKINNAKDVSDLYKSLTDKSKFKEIIKSIFNYE